MWVWVFTGGPGSKYNTWTFEFVGNWFAWELEITVSVCKERYLSTQTRHRRSCNREGLYLRETWVPFFLPAICHMAHVIYAIKGWQMKAAENVWVNRVARKPKPVSLFCCTARIMKNSFKRRVPYTISIPNPNGIHHSKNTSGYQYF